MQRVLEYAQEDLHRQTAEVAQGTSIRRADLIGFIRVLDRPPALGLPLFTLAREDMPLNNPCIVAQEIDAEDRINAFVPFDPEDLEVIHVEIDLKKTKGDKCVLVYEIDYDQVLIGDHSNVRERLASHLGNETFLSNPFSFYQAAQFCRSEPAIHEAVCRMQFTEGHASNVTLYSLERPDP